MKSYLSSFYSSANTLTHFYAIIKYCKHTKQAFYEYHYSKRYFNLSLVFSCLHVVIMSHMQRKVKAISHLFLCQKAGLQVEQTPILGQVFDRIIFSNSQISSVCYGLYLLKELVPIIIPGRRVHMIMTIYLVSFTASDYSSLGRVIIWAVFHRYFTFPTFHLLDMGRSEFIIHIKVTEF